MSSVRRTPTLQRWLDGAPSGWTVVSASVIVNAISDGTWFYSFAVFFLPISRDLALSRAAERRGQQRTGNAVGLVALDEGDGRQRRAPREHSARAG